MAGSKLLSARDVVKDESHVACGHAQSLCIAGKGGYVLVQHRVIRGRLCSAWSDGESIEQVKDEEHHA